MIQDWSAEGFQGNSLTSTFTLFTINKQLVITTTSTV